MGRRILLAGGSVVNWANATSTLAPELEIEVGTDRPAWIESAESKVPGVVLVSDVEVCRRWKAADRSWHIPIVWITGDATSAEDRMVALESGADAFLARDADPREAVALLRALIRGNDRAAGIPMDAQQDLRETEDNYRALFDNAAEIIFIVDPSGQIITANAAACRQYGYTPAEYRSMTIADVDFGTDRDLAKARIDEIMVKGESHFRASHRRKDGTDVLVEVNSRRITWNGKPAIFGCCRDLTARDRVEEALKQSEARFHTLADHISQLAWMAGPEGSRFWYNQRWYEYTGTTPEAMHGWGWQSVHHPEEVGRMQAHAEHSIQTGEPWEDKVRLRGKDGTYRWFLCRVVPIRDSVGRVVRWFGTDTDVTRLLDAEQSARESRAKLEAAFGSMTDAVFICDREGRFIEYNDAFRTFHHFRRGEPVSRSIAEYRELVDVFLPDGSPAPPDFRPVSRALRGESVSNAEYCLRRKDTGEAWCGSFSFGPIRDKSGAIVGIVVVARDITERKQAEAELVKTNLRLELAARSGHLGIWEWDIVSDSLTWDDRMFELYGISRDQFSGLYEVWRNALHPEDRERAVGIIEAAVRGERTYDLEFRVVHPDGTVRHIKADGLVVRDCTGRAVRMIGLNRDITDSKLAEEHKSQLEAQLQQAQKMESIGRLAAGVAHDFNNLLTVINGYSRMALADLPESDPLREQLLEIEHAGDRAAGLTRQLLAFSRKQILKPRLLDLNRVVTDMRSMLSRLVGDDVEVQLTLASQPLAVHADPHQLEQVIMNLAVNARDAMPDGGCMSIQTAVVEREKRGPGPGVDGQVCQFALLTIKDTGVGMDRATQQRIFEPFYTTKGTGKGTGLGLSTVLGIVEQSGGSIEVWSEPGQGTAFHIYLPAATGAVPENSHAPASRAAQGHETILVVEDQPEVRKFASAALEQLGYHVFSAAGPEEALDFFADPRHHFDLVLTDLVMPHMSGRELAEHLVKIQPGIRILFMTGYTDDEAVLQGALGNFSRLIQKPFQPAELAAKVRELLSLRGKPRILIVDDEPGVRSYLHKVLENAGYQVAEAAEGRQAMRQAHAGPLDLVITDLVMPEQEGMETIRKLKKEFPTVAILAISGAFGGTLLRVAEMLGADAVLPKPVVPEQLLERIAAVLQSHKVH
jgi:two-component system cell cycle sensor histidine kinase/response regulator CckA